MAKWTDEALDLAYELNQIREIYGPDCANECERMIRASESTDWKTIITATVTRWQHRRVSMLSSSWAS